MDNNKVLFIVRFRLKKSRGIINTRSFLPQAICETFHKRQNPQWGKARSPHSPQVRECPSPRHSDTRHQNRRPRISLIIRSSVPRVRPKPTPKLNSQSGEKFKSTTGKSWCCCSLALAKFPICPRSP